MINDALQDAESRMKGALGSLTDDLAAIRTGRASTAVFEKLSVNYYDTPTPLLQLATISAPEPQLITIRPFDPTTVTLIGKAIQSSNLGLTPTDDGKIIRLSIPPMTEERRKVVAKDVSKRVEEAKVAARNIRRDTLEFLRDLEKEKEVSEDEFHTGKDQLQKITDRYTNEIEETGKRKEQEILEV